MNEAVSFRDPGGCVTVSQERVLRTVFPEGRANLEACLESQVAKRLVENGSLISTQPPKGDRSAPSSTLIVEHPRIPFVSYPHEWPAAMLHAAGELTLQLCAALLEEGRGLKDAAPSNILFRGPQPVFVDILSFENRDPLDPIWLADAQFARTFLIPLLLHRRVGFPIHELFLFQRDGIPPTEAVRRLPRLRRWLPPDLGLVTIPARASRLEKPALYKPRTTSEPTQARFILEHRFRALQKKLNALTPLPTASAWSSYETAKPSYSTEQHAAKHDFVKSMLADVRPQRLLDIGANTGEFSLLAAAEGASVVAIDRDPESVAALWRTARAAHADILPLIVDFARPTPAAGWRGREHESFLERADGHFDCVLFLAVMHHLMVTDQIPADQILDALSSLRARWLVVEYVAPQDPLFRRLARGRDNLYSGYSRDIFELLALRHFDIVQQRTLPASDRSLYLLRRKS